MYSIAKFFKCILGMYFFSHSFRFNRGMVDYCTSIKYCVKFIHYFIYHDCQTMYSAISDSYVHRYASLGLWSRLNQDHSNFRTNFIDFTNLMYFRFSLVVIRLCKINKIRLLESMVDWHYAFSDGIINYGEFNSQLSIIFCHNILHSPWSYIVCLFLWFIFEISIKYSNLIESHQYLMNCQMHFNFNQTILIKNDHIG